jgi:hypothetical protein
MFRWLRSRVITCCLWPDDPSARSREGECWHFAGIARRFTTARGVRVGISARSPVRKYSPQRCSDSLRLTELSNVVACVCRSSSRKDRHDVHQHPRLNRRGAIGGRREYDAHGLASARSWPSNEGRKGRKGRKPRIRRKDGPCRRCREAAETGGNWRKLVFGALSRYESILGGAARIRQSGSGNCGNPHRGRSTRHEGTRSKPSRRGRSPCASPSAAPVRSCGRPCTSSCRARAWPADRSWRWRAPR